MAQNPFDIKPLGRDSMSPLKDLLAMNRKRRDAEEKAKASQAKADQSIILNKIPSKVWIDPKTGKHMMQGKDGDEVVIDIDRYNIEQARNKEIQQAYNRTYRPPDSEKQNYPLAPKSMVATKSKGNKADNTYADGTPKMGTLDKVKLMPEMLRQGLSSFMSGNRGGQVIGQPNVPQALTDAPKLFDSANMRLPLPAPDKRLQKNTERSIRQYARGKRINDVLAGGRKVTEELKKPIQNLRSRYKQSMEQNQPYIQAMKDATPSFGEALNNYIQGVKSRINTGKKVLEYAMPQARVLQKKPKSSKKSYRDMIRQQLEQ